ncbi:MAG: molecular chaperone TorD family protein [Deltaproteobacteria bacterium]|nr:molecular chaperone TorD family protein [Deltaproteobacteria bacterium]
MVSYTPKTALLQSLQKLCSIFWGPNLEKCGEILAEDYFLPFKAVGSDPGNDVQDTLDKIRDSIGNFSDEKVFFNHLEEAYVRLFVNARGGIVAPLYQSCYIGTEEIGTKASLMGEPAVLMKQRFKSKGLSLASNMNEPPDHLAIELEYLYFLLEKGWADKSNEFVVEAAFFADQTMLPWVIQFRNLLKNETMCPLYPLSVNLLVSVLMVIADLDKVKQKTES